MVPWTSRLRAVFDVSEQCWSADVAWGSAVRGCSPPFRKHFQYQCVLEVLSRQLPASPSHLVKCSMSLHIYLTGRCLVHTSPSTQLYEPNVSLWFGRLYQINRSCIIDLLLHCRSCSRSWCHITAWVPCGDVGAAVETGPARCTTPPQPRSASSMQCRGGWLQRYFGHNGQRMPVHVLVFWPNGSVWHRWGKCGHARLLFILVQHYKK